MHHATVFARSNGGALSAARVKTGIHAKRIRARRGSTAEKWGMGFKVETLQKWKGGKWEKWETRLHQARFGSRIGLGGSGCSGK
jgi:hypothetical protein